MDDENGEMNTNEAALQIGIPAKKLRGFIRADPNNLGVEQHDGRWVFSARDVTRLRQLLNPRVSGGGGVDGRKRVEIDDLTPYQRLVISRKDARINREVMERHLVRVDRIDQGLLRAGLHITQRGEE